MKKKNLNQVIETQVEVWENKRYCGNTSGQVIASIRQYYRMCTSLRFLSHLEIESEQSTVLE